ncbi:hypothetical protein D3C78_1562480 [compost metagenome]
MNPGKAANLMPTTVAAVIPIITCPSAPILNIPERNAKATAKPVSINGVISRTASPKLYKLPNTRENSAE